MSWKRSEDVKQGDWLRDVGRVVSVARPDRQGRIPMSVAPSQESARATGFCDTHQGVNLGAGGVVEVADETDGRRYQG